MTRTLVLDQNPIVHTAFEKISSDSNNMGLHPPAYYYSHALKILNHDSNVDFIIIEVEQLEISPVTLIKKFK